MQINQVDLCNHIDAIKAISKFDSYNLILDGYFLGYQIGQTMEKENMFYEALQIILEQNKYLSNKTRTTEDKIKQYDQIINRKRETIPQEQNTPQNVNNYNVQRKEERMNILNLPLSNTKVQYRNQVPKYNFEEQEMCDIESKIIVNKWSPSPLKQKTEIGEHHQATDYRQQQIRFGQLQQPLKLQKIDENRKNVLFKPPQNFPYQNPICTICLEAINQKDTFNLDLCKHVFHKECLAIYIKTQSYLPISCPQHGCRVQIKESDLSQIIDSKTFEKLDKNSLNKYLMQYFQCPTKGCQGLYEIEGPIVICQLCQQAYCAKCRKNYHDDEECSDDNFLKLVKKENYKQCEKCFFWVEKTDGCNHIKCRCGHEFCYHCGKEWIKGEECRCLSPEEMLRNVTFFLIQPKLMTLQSKGEAQNIYQYLQYIIEMMRETEVAIKTVSEKSLLPIINFDLDFLAIQKKIKLAREQMQGQGMLEKVQFINNIDDSYLNCYQCKPLMNERPFYPQQLQPNLFENPENLYVHQYQPVYQIHQQQQPLIAKKQFQFRCHEMRDEKQENQDQ